MSLVGFKARNHPQQAAKPHVDDRALTMVDFEPLHKRFMFTLDAAATAENTKLPRFFSRADDGLAQSWAGERVYCNPPYSDIAPWLHKAWTETEANLIVMLLPANRTEQGWWQEYIERYRDGDGPLRTEFMRGRLRFLKPEADEIKPNERPPFGCVLCIWDFPIFTPRTSRAPVAFYAKPVSVWATDVAEAVRQDETTDRRVRASSAGGEEP